MLIDLARGWFTSSEEMLDSLVHRIPGGIEGKTVEGLIVLWVQVGLSGVERRAIMTQLKFGCLWAIPHDPILTWPLCNPLSPERGLLVG